MAVDDEISSLESSLSECISNIATYYQMIYEIKAAIDGTVEMLKQESNLEVVNIALANGPYNTENLKKNIVAVSTVKPSGNMINYSVNQSDLIFKDSLLINGQEVKLYTAKNTDAVYVVASFDQKYGKERKELIKSLKDVLPKNTMAIVTYGNSLYHYDTNNEKNCSTNYDVVGKTDAGRMYAFKWRKDSQVIVDNTGKDRTLITTINGMVLANQMDLVMETDANIHIKVRPKTNILGGQTIEEFVRLAFTPGNKNVSMTMDGEWQRYANTPENKANGTWISNWSGGGEGKPNHRAVSVGAGPSEKYAYTQATVGHVDSPVIPVTIRSTNKAGYQLLNGSVNYHFSGARRNNDKDHRNATSKDFLSYHQTTVKDWS